MPIRRRALAPALLLALSACGGKPAAHRGNPPSLAATQRPAAIKLQAPDPASPLRTFEQIAALPDAQFDVAEAVLSLASECGMLSGDASAALAELDRLAGRIENNLPENPGGIDYCDELFDVVLERRKAEPFREDRAEDYDLSYTVAKRRGSCLSASILALAVARRAGAPMWGAQCPAHFFLKYVPPPGAGTSDMPLNFDATRPAPSNWRQIDDRFYRRWRPVSPQAEATAGYLRPLTDREVVSAYLGSRAGFFAMKNEQGRALNDSRRALELNANNVTACINGGLAHESLGEAAEAGKLYTRALRIDALSVRALNNLAYLKVRDPESKQFDPKEAERLIQTALNEEPRRAFLHATHAEVAAAKADWRAATRAMQEAIRLDGKNPRYRERFMELRKHLRGEE